MLQANNELGELTCYSDIMRFNSNISSKHGPAFTVLHNLVWHAADAIYLSSNGKMLTGWFGMRICINSVQCRSAHGSQPSAEN